MARPPSRYPTELELEILKVVWREGNVSVGQVREALKPTRPLAYNSVLTMMGIMHRKGYLKRKIDKTGLRHVYSPKVSQENIQKGMLHDIIDRVFDGSAAGAFPHIMDCKFSEDEIRELRRVFAEKVK